MRSLTLRCAIAVLFLWAGIGTWAHASEGDAKVVSDFLEAWETHDVDKIMSFVSEDCHYENFPSLSGENPVIKGRANMRAFLAPFFVKDPLIAPFEFHTEIKHVVVGDGAVASERVDHFKIGHSKFTLPVAGFFKVRNGKIVYWKDYFDGPTIEPITTLMTALAKKDKKDKKKK